MPETFGSWLGVVNSCIYHVCQTPMVEQRPDFELTQDIIHPLYIMDNYGVSVRSFSKKIDCVMIWPKAIWLLPCNHYDIIKWNYFPCYCPFMQGMHQSPVDSPHKGTVMWTFNVSLLSIWTNCWTNTWLVIGDAMKVIYLTVTWGIIVLHVKGHHFNVNTIFLGMGIIFIMGIPILVGQHIE